tara:strand:- start:267 stop:581 length:315 start_codon:yes stop_codon:yes gene_type:complete
MKNQQNLLNEYDELLSEITEEVSTIFDESIENHEEGDCLICQIAEYMDDNKTRHMAGMLKVSKQDPKLVLYLLTHMKAQFASYQVMADKMLDTFLELHSPEELN